MNLLINESPNTDEVQIIEDLLDEESKITDLNCEIGNKMIFESRMWHGKRTRYEVFLFMIDNEPVGFVEWKEDEMQDAYILGFYISFKLRSKNLGRLFYNKFEDYLKNNNYNKVGLYCKWNNARRFWKDKCKFIEVLGSLDKEGGYDYYKSL